MHVFRSIRWVFTGLVALVGLAVIYYNFILSTGRRGPVVTRELCSPSKPGWTKRAWTRTATQTHFRTWVEPAEIHSWLFGEEMGGRTDWAVITDTCPDCARMIPDSCCSCISTVRPDGDDTVSHALFFKEKKWLVVPVDFGLGRPVQGELSERITTDDFKRRLGATIDFVRTNQRPNWQTVVAEHTKFLQSLEQVGR